MKKIFENYFINEQGEVFNKHSRKLSPSYNGKGYLVLGLMHGGKRKTVAVHRLLAQAFIPNLLKLPEVNHINGIRDDNSLQNLEWVTHGDNIKHSYELGNKSVKGSLNPNASISEQTVHEICKFLQDGFKSSEIRDLGYNYNIVRKIKRKSIWQDISKEYNF